MNKSTLEPIDIMLKCNSGKCKSDFQRKEIIQQNSLPQKLFIDFVYKNWESIQKKFWKIIYFKNWINLLVIPNMEWKISFKKEVKNNEEF